MEPGKATPRKDRWKMQVKATRDRRCRIRVASPSRRPGIHPPRRTNFSRLARENPPFRPLYRQRSRVRLRHPGSRRNRMTLFLNPATCTIQFSVYISSANAPRNFVICRARIRDDALCLSRCKISRHGYQGKNIEGDYLEIAIGDVNDFLINESQGEEYKCLDRIISSGARMRWRDENSSKGEGGGCKHKSPAS